MSLRKYGIILKKYLKEIKPLKYSKLTIDGDLMDYLLEEEKYLYKMIDGLYNKDLFMPYGLSNIYFSFKLLVGKPIL